LSLDFPFPIYGYLYNSFTNENEGDTNITITFADGTDVIVTTDSNGFYEIDVQDYANDGEDINFECETGTWRATETYTLNITDFSHEQIVTLDEEITNLKIWYGDGADEFIACWCSNWKVRDMSVMITTWLNKTQVDYLKDNTRPGAVDSKKIIGYGYMNTDTTYDGSNTLRFEPYDVETSELYNIRRETTGYVKSLSIAPIPGQELFVVRIECLVSGQTR
jgi:hypothetical protein